MPGLWLAAGWQIWLQLFAFAAVTNSQPTQADNSYMRRQSVLTHKGEILTDQKRATAEPHRSDARHHVAMQIHRRKQLPKSKRTHRSRMFFGKGQPGTRALAKLKRKRQKKSVTEVHHQRHRASMLQAQRNVTAAPASLMPATGQSIALTNAAKFNKEFTIKFKVKIHNFLRNYQMLVSTDQHALLIQVLGPSHVENATKISAWFKTDSGLGPDGRGIFGSDGHGQLMSQKLHPNTWYDVTYHKSLNSVSLTVDGQTVSSTANPNIIIHQPDFFMESGSLHLLTGKMAGSGDQALDGEMGDIAVVEGSSA